MNFDPFLARVVRVTDQLGSEIDGKRMAYLISSDSANHVLVLSNDRTYSTRRRHVEILRKDDVTKNIQCKWGEKIPPQNDHVDLPIWTIFSPTTTIQCLFSPLELSQLVPIFRSATKYKMECTASPRHTILFHIHGTGTGRGLVFFFIEILRF